MKYKNGSEIVFGKVKDPLRGGKPMKQPTLIEQEIEVFISKMGLVDNTIHSFSTGSMEYKRDLVDSAHKAEMEFRKELKAFASRIVESVKKEERKQIKKAFWKEFYEAGELWFPYDDLDDEESKQAAVQNHWSNILDTLEEMRTKLQMMKADTLIGGK